MQASVQLERVGKLQPADRVATSSSAGIQDCRNLRLFVTDKNTGLRFLVDSGADISIIPPKDKNRMPSSDYKLYAANGTEIVTYGTKVRNLDIGLRRQFQWPFVIANTNRAIIGADFLNNFGLIIDIKNKRLIDGITNLSIRGVIQSISDMGNISTLNSSSKISAILTKYPNLCRPPSDFVEAKHGVKHYIPTRGQPIHSKARRLDSQRLTLAKAEFQYMLNNGIIRPSNSPWASPLHLVSKKDESLRPCGDYRRLNAVTLPDRYPIPRLDDFHHILKGTRVYSKIDLCKAFYQIPIAEEDKPKTAIITPFGLFEFNVMSFGLRNATATFQRFMHEVLRNLDFAFVYLDDILVASKTEEEHYSHLETLFSRLNSYGLRINLSKSKFLVQEIDFLGYLITSHGVKPLPTKVKAILEYKKPKTVHELRIFLGMLNFYRTFLNNAAETQAILHEYLRGAKKKDRSEIKWTEEAEVQFEKCKQALANTALLAYPDTELPISLCTDASDRAVGSVLQQLDNNNWKPIAFFSKKLNPAQCNYSTYDRELLAIYLSIKFFKHLLEAREFTILTDHKPLIYAFKQKNEKASPRQLRHLQYISQFTTDIKYIKGTDNIVADALSRVDAITTIDYEEIAKEQTGDSELQNLISKNTSLKFKQCPLQSGNLLWCDVSTNNIRPFIPIKFRMMVFRNFHELSHPGIKATTKQLTSRFIWPNMNKDIRKWAQACVNCQKCKVSIHTKSEIGKYQEVDERFSVVHIDLIGALPPSNGNIYCLTCIDRYTSWMEVVPLPDMKSETVARAFYENWIVRFGAPHTVISDQGKQFTSQLFKDLTTLCGIKLRHSTAYHPQCNGKIERLHRTIKTAIRAHNSIKWTETLPTVLLGLRAAINKDTNHSLSQMVYGKTIRLPGEFFDDSKHHLHAEEFVQQLQKQMELLKPFNEKHHSKTKVFVHKDLKTCSHVFIRTDRVKKPLEPPYEGPFPVLERTDKYFTLKVKGKNVTTSIDRLRPAYLLADSDNITAEHPTAARPIASGALPSTSSQQNPDPPDVEKYTEFQGTGSAPDLPRTRSGRIIKKPLPDSRALEILTIVACLFSGWHGLSISMVCGEGMEIMVYGSGTSIDYLGYKISSGTCTPLVRNIDVINAIKPPTNVKTLQSFLGAINVYNKFIPDYALIRNSLNQLLKKNVKWEWTSDCQKAFDKLKQLLSSGPILHLYKSDLPCQVYSDASLQGIGGVLKQLHLSLSPDGNSYPVQYYSRTLRKYERNYTITELECLAIIETVDRFKVYLAGNGFTIFTDHCALQWLKNIKNPTGRLFRWSLRLSVYDYQVKYIKGTKQLEADLLSRNPFCGLLDATQLKMYQSELRDNSKYVHQTSGLTTVTRRGVSKIVVPPSLRLTILREAHQKFNHPGISQLTRIISAQYFWSGMSIDIRAFVKNCNICQMSKTPKGPKYGELGELPESPLPFDLVSMDTIAGFARYGSAKNYLHVVVDHATRFAWTFPSCSTSTTTYIQVINKVLQSGCPKRLLTDRAPAFTSPRFRRFLISHNIQPMLTTSNHPQANGLSERLNATLTGKLRLLHLQHPRASWTMLQSKVVKAYNDTPHSVTGFPPSYLMDCSLPKELSQHLDPYPSVTESRRLALQRTKERHKLDKVRFDKNHRSPDFEVGDLVLTKIYQHPNTGKLVPYFSGPYEIIEVISPYTVRINRPNQAQNLDTEIIHVNKLKHYSEDTKYIFTPHSTNNNSKPKSYFIYNHFPPEIFHDDYKNYASTLSNPFNHMNPDIFLDNVEPTLTARYISTPDTIPKIAIRLEPSPTTKIMLPSSPTRNHTPQISPQFSAPLINCDNTKLENRSVIIR
ncbi:hypothetical protein LAZ67_3006298, partial [Cordylochernes scorpioides]